MTRKKERILRSGKTSQKNDKTVTGDRYGISDKQNGMYVLSIWDQEELHNVAEEVIVSLRYRRYYFYGEGNYIMDQLSKEERQALFEKHDANAKKNYLNFRENEELHQLSFHDALYMSLEEIKEKYLKDVLPVARGILQKDTTDFCFKFVISDEVPDSYIDDLLALRWRENLKIRTIQWDNEKRKGKEE